MKKRTQLAALLLALLTVTPAIASCAEKTEDEGNITDAAVTDISTEPVVTSAMDTIETQNLDGYKFRVILDNGDNRHLDFETEGQETGEVFNDIVHRRNTTVEEALNITIEVTVNNDHPNLLQRSVSGNEVAYEMYVGSSHAASLAPKGYLYALNDMPILDLSNPWWDPAANNGLSVQGNIYLTAGDIAPNSLRTSSCLVFNKVLFDNRNMTYPYQEAYDGTWTIDRLVEMTKGLTEDLNGDSKITYGTDLYSMSCWIADIPFSLFYGAGGTFTGKDEEDIPYLDLDVNKIDEIYGKMYEIIHTNQAYLVNDAGKYETTYKNFVEGRSYFCEITLQKIDIFLRDMEQNYGILPIPKYNEAQEGYLSFVNAAGSLIHLQSNLVDVEQVGLIVEAMGAASYDKITPSLYETITKTKNVRDQESADMVNLIVRNRVFDPYYINLLSEYSVLQGMINSKSQSVASALESKRKVMTKTLEKLVDAYLSSNQ